MIVYRDGPTGRQAALAVGPDVWEVISAAAAARDGRALVTENVKDFAAEHDIVIAEDGALTVWSPVVAPGPQS